MIYLKANPSPVLKAKSSKSDTGENVESELPKEMLTLLSTKKPRSIFDRIDHCVEYEVEGISQDQGADAEKGGVVA